MTENALLIVYSLVAACTLVLSLNIMAKRRDLTRRELKSRLLILCFGWALLIAPLAFAGLLGAIVA
ncbi:hypothetical protein G7078_00315 [Sphingomonas sinipercae]|uniref:Uncharacterized protein n=1 Tax=Sphingomonas sinipercae TaxID=2714944 RepID=A0A6G7ZKE2_9SPHN|nr:hypothetical protein [Sphingomonas sinipercae]QIL01388.1 hypothetical protein G7078_00315 [Sphingomonas sinipercae]